MTLGEIGKMIESAIKDNEGKTINGEKIIVKIDGDIYFKKSFLLEYGDIIRLKLRDKFWMESEIMRVK